MKVTIDIKYTIDTEVSNDATIGVHTDALPGCATVYPQRGFRPTFWRAAAG
jgi:hypothetical protein